MNSKRILISIVFILMVVICYGQSYQLSEILVAPFYSGYYRFLVDSSGANVNLKYQNLDENIQFEYIFNSELNPEIIETEITTQITKELSYFNNPFSKDVNDFESYYIFKSNIGNLLGQLKALPLTGIRFYNMGMFKSDDYIDYKDKVGILLSLSDGRNRIIELNKHPEEDYITPLGITSFNYYGEEYFLIPMAQEGGVSAWDYFIRIYDENLELIYQSEIVGDFFPNKHITPVCIDLNKDNKDEIILFSYDGMKPDFRVVTLEKSSIEYPIIELSDNDENVKSEFVIKIQKILKSNNYDIGQNGVTGIYNKETYNAIIKFQEDNEIIDTGVIDRVTWIDLLKKE